MRGWILGDARAGDRRMVGAIIIGAFVALVAANFAYIYPILTDELLPYPEVAVAHVVPDLDLSRTLLDHDHRTAQISTVIAGPPAAGSPFPKVLSWLRTTGSTRRRVAGVMGEGESMEQPRDQMRFSIIVPAY